MIDEKWQADFDELVEEFEQLEEQKIAALGPIIDPIEIDAVTAEQLLELGIQLRDAVDMLSLGLAQLIPVRV